MESRKDFVGNKIAFFGGDPFSPSTQPRFLVVSRGKWKHPGYGVMELAIALGMVFSGWIAVRFAILAYRLARGDSTEYEQNRMRAGSFLASLRGQIPTHFDGGRDYRVAAGIAVDKRTNTWVEQGRLSSEAINAVLRQSHR